MSSLFDPQPPVSEALEINMLSTASKERLSVEKEKLIVSSQKDMRKAMERCNFFEARQHFLQIQELTRA